MSDLIKAHTAHAACTGLHCAGSLAAVRAILGRTVLAVAIAAILACESAPPAPGTAPASPAASAPVGTTSGPGSTGVPSPAPAPPNETPRAPPAPPSAAAQQQAQRGAQGVVELLELGNEEQARSELQRALALDPGNKLALSLQRQMSEDPVATLGRESFAYVVRAGDTLSRIAGRFLGDIYAFHILARYNNIKVPRQVGEGQTLRIPGKAPPVVNAPSGPSGRVPNDAPAPAPVPPVPEPAPAEPSLADKAYASGEAAAKAGNDDQALNAYKRAAALGHPDGAAKAQATLKSVVDRNTRMARGALARQDLAGAIRAWNRVLEVDPGNEIARLEREKALQLQEKVKKL